MRCHASHCGLLQPQAMTRRPTADASRIVPAGGHQRPCCFCRPAMAAADVRSATVAMDRPSAAVLTPRWPRTPSNDAFWSGFHTLQLPAQIQVYPPRR